MTFINPFQPCLLTPAFVPVGAKSELMPLDIEYTMWANPSSEIQYFGWADGRAGEAIRSKHRPVKVREDCAVVLPRSVGKLKSQAKVEWSILFDDPAPPVIAANRDWIATLESAVEQGKTKWLAVIMEGFEPSMRGAELFLERRLEDCDAAHSGYAFAMMTPEVAAWARRQKLDSLVWQQGQPVKYPKLSGPLTLWRRSFLRALLKAWKASGMAVPLEMFLAGWAEKGRAKLVNTSSAAQGWKAVRATSSK